MNENHITINGQLTYEEFKQYNYYHSKKTYNQYFIGTFLISFIGIYILFYDELGLTLTIGIPLFVAFLGYTALKIVLTRISKNNYYNNPLIKINSTYTISNEGIDINNERTSTKYLWDDVISVYEYNDMFLLYITKSSAIILPKRYFNGIDEIDMVRNLLIEKVKFKRVLIER